MQKQINKCLACDSNGLCLRPCKDMYCGLHDHFLTREVCMVEGKTLCTERSLSNGRCKKHEKVCFCGREIENDEVCDKHKVEGKTCGRIISGIRCKNETYSQNVCEEHFGNNKDAICVVTMNDIEYAMDMETTKILGKYTKSEIIPTEKDDEFILTKLGLK